MIASVGGGGCEHYGPVVMENEADSHGLTLCVDRTVLCARAVCAIFISSVDKRAGRSLALAGHFPSTMASMIKAPRSTHTGKLRVLLIACGFVLLSLLNDILYENVWLYNLQSPQYSTKHLGDGDDGVRRTYDIQEEASLQSYIPSFIPVSQLNFDRQDSFAASWWQTVDRFLDCDLDLIENVEGDVFVVINQAGNGEDDVVMTKDFLDFSVEHVSETGGSESVSV